MDYVAFISLNKKGGGSVSYLCFKVLKGILLFIPSKGLNLKGFITPSEFLEDPNT